MHLESLARSLSQILSSDRYCVIQMTSEAEFLDLMERQKQHLDCLLLYEDRSLRPLVNRLYDQGILLPTVIFHSESKASRDLGRKEENYPSSPPFHRETAQSFTQRNSPQSRPPDGELAGISSQDEPNPLLLTYFFHPAEVLSSVNQTNQIRFLINQAIAHFLELGPSCRLPKEPTIFDPTTELSTVNFLMVQQLRLAEKLKERLGYLGVYYKRNPQQFFRNLSQSEKQELLEALASEYRQIILNYFSIDDTLNQKIDEFASTAFFADVSVSQIVEIHMELMDEFSKHLKLEGRSEEVLLDYRLTLIDVIAHLCEMYRRSIPREL